MDSHCETNSGSSAQAEIFDSIRRRRGCACTARKFSRLPVEQSSSTTTFFPSASNRSTRCEPMNPAPPVTRVSGSEDGGRGREDGGWRTEDGIAMGLSFGLWCYSDEIAAFTIRLAKVLPL